MAYAQTFEVRALHAQVEAESFDLETELEAAVEAALLAGEGCVPGVRGFARLRETEMSLAEVIQSAVFDDDVLAALIAVLKTDAGDALRHEIAIEHAQTHADGIREAREQAMEDES